MPVSTVASPSPALSSMRKARSSDVSRAARSACRPIGSRHGRRTHTHRERITHMTDHELRALALELRCRDPRFLRIVSTNPAEGQGEYELRSATTGKTLTSAFTFCEQHGRILTPLFDEATTLRLAADVAAAPDPYAAPLAAMRAASATPASKFEEQWKAERLRALQGEYVEIAAQGEASPSVRLTVGDLAAYAAPDAYAEGLEKIRNMRRK